MKNLFWKTPEWLKQLLKPHHPNSLTFTAYKEGNEWFFNLAPITWGETLCFPEVLDELSHGKDKLKLSVTTYPVEGALTAHYLWDDVWCQEGSIYAFGEHNIYLCPWLQWFFGTKPECLWLIAS